MLTLRTPHRQPITVHIPRLLTAFRARAILAAPMKNRDSNDALSALLAAAVDLCAIWLAQMLAV